MGTLTTPTYNVGGEGGGEPPSRSLCIRPEDDRDCPRGRQLVFLRLSTMSIDRYLTNKRTSQSPYEKIDRSKGGEFREGGHEERIGPPVVGICWN